MSWRVAKSLLTLRDQVNALYPNRDKSSDGTIGDERHQATHSEHNPDDNGVVRAMDISNDPAHGVVSDKIAHALIDSRDPRIMYVISNSKICSATVHPWEWRDYGGSNPHDHHFHISVVADPAKYDDTRPWTAIGATPLVQPIPPLLPQYVTAASANRLKMAKAILDFEARRDSRGHLAVYNLPANDGGGRYEVAGINEKYDGPMVRELVDLIENGKFDEAEKEAVKYIASNTDVASTWTTSPAVESYLRDCVFNRGARGAARILQRAVGVEDDGYVGPITRAAIAKVSPANLLIKLRSAREEYEEHVVGHRANFWAGLTARWNGALATAQKYLA